MCLSAGVYSRCWTSSTSAITLPSLLKGIPLRQRKRRRRRGSILHFRSKAFHVAFRLSIRLRFVIVTRRPKAFSSEKVNDGGDSSFQEGARRKGAGRTGLGCVRRRWRRLLSVTDSTSTCKRLISSVSRIVGRDGALKRLHVITLHVRTVLYPGTRCSDVSTDDRRNWASIPPVASPAMGHWGSLPLDSASLWNTSISYPITIVCVRTRTYLTLTLTHKREAATISLLYLEVI